MALTIPNEADAAFADQAEPDARDFSDILSPAFALTGVLTGCSVTAQGSPDMTVAVAAGRVLVAGLEVAVAAGNVTITAADGTNPRFDMICVSSAGAKSAVAGTAAANPVFPDPAGKVVLAAVYVPASDTDIDANQIVDKRAVLLPSMRPRVKTGSDHYYWLPGLLAAQTPGLDVMIAFPVWLPGGITLKVLGIEVTTLGATATPRLGIYRDDGEGRPGPLLLDAGTVSGATTGNKEKAISQLIDVSGYYWLAFVNQVATCAVRAYNAGPTRGEPVCSLTTAPTSSHNNAMFQVSGISGALPDPFGTHVFTTGNNPRVYWMVD